MRKAIFQDKESIIPKRCEERACDIRVPWYWRAVFHAVIRLADVSRCVIPDHTDIQGIEDGKDLKDFVIC